MGAKIRFGAVSLDSAEPRRLAEFYRDLLGFEIRYESQRLIVLQGDGVMVTVERVADHRAPDWPGNEVPKQMHLDLFVADLDDGERAAIACGAVKAGFQPAPDQWRVFLDPSGHPFCLTVSAGPGID
ncbi:glyoxalase [Nocardia mangyaensis]|uniref:Glyoxalase n=1 Tax=Nocardia mangyaensis TaxID=2213200 RepID=A0A1J0VU25_9NOCA|nr:VOC family protein [Nocardia mangyaensis]APE35506.1 glyoxalase [Nocardia mangyaensis]